ncbi:MAG: GyrI-like domain-containing protein [Deltaproteobacteria bacterium]|nr:GyrI-like domain-containing protein [Deltaproteobacteria bacterium]
MDTIIKKKETFSVLGVQSQINQGSETSELFAGIWKLFESYREIIESLSIDNKYFGIQFPTDKGEVTEYMAGMMVEEDSVVPEGLAKRVVPSGEYAAFVCPVEEIGKYYQYIFTKWLPSASVLFNPRNPVFEEYPEKYSTGPVCIHIPITKYVKVD